MKLKTVLSLSVFLILTACSDNKTREYSNHEKSILLAAKYSLSENDLQQLFAKYGHDDICKASVHSWMMSPSFNLYNVKAKKNSVKDEYLVSFNRESDGKYWAYDCFVTGNRVYWNSEGGTVKTHELSEQTFASIDINTGALLITIDQINSSPESYSYSYQDIVDAR